MDHGLPQGQIDLPSFSDMEQRILRLGDFFSKSAVAPHAFENAIMYGMTYMTNVQLIMPTPQHYETKEAQQLYRKLRNQGLNSQRAAEMVKMILEEDFLVPSKAGSPKIWIDDVPDEEAEKEYRKAATKNYVNLQPKFNRGTRKK